MKELTREQIKERAKFLRQVLREKHNIDLPHGHSLEVLSKVLGHKDWNTASALSTNSGNEKPISADKQTSVEKPVATKLQTVGEMVDFLSLYDRSKRLIVSEYSNNLKSGETITSACSLTYDSEIQNGPELRFELNTEEELNEGVTIGGSRSAAQTFDHTAAGRLQRRIKYLFMQKSFWNPKFKS